jgi:hypothetical protein
LLRSGYSGTRSYIFLGTWCQLFISFPPLISQGILKVLEAKILKSDFDGIMLCLQSLPEQVYVLSFPARTSFPLLFIVSSSELTSQGFDDRDLFKCIKSIELSGSEYRMALRRHASK